MKAHRLILAVAPVCATAFAMAREAGPLDLNRTLGNIDPATAYVPLLKVEPVQSTTAAAPPATSTSEPIALNFAWVPSKNEPLTVLSYTLSDAHSSLFLPAITLSTIAFTGTYDGVSGLVAGAGVQLSTTWKGLLLSAGAGEAISNAQKPALVLFAGVTLPVRT